MNWIKPKKRLAIYLRDGLGCVYCGEGIEDGAKLTLDHLKPYKSGGTNNETNLVTCCHRCNCARGTRSWKLFAEQVSQYINHGVTAKAIITKIGAVRAKKLDCKAAQELIESRGGFSAALKEIKQA
jgi:hypothetical protein